MGQWGRLDPRFSVSNAGNGGVPCRDYPPRYPGGPRHAIKAIGLLLLCLLPIPGFADSEQSLKWRQKALEFEKRGAWLEACRCWDASRERTATIRHSAKLSSAACGSYTWLPGTTTRSIAKPCRNSLLPSRSTPTSRCLRLAGLPRPGKDQLDRALRAGIAGATVGARFPRVPQALPARRETRGLESLPRPAGRLAGAENLLGAEAREQVTAVIRSVLRDGLPCPCRFFVPSRWSSPPGVQRLG